MDEEKQEGEEQSQPEEPIANGDASIPAGEANAGETSDGEVRKAQFASLTEDAISKNPIDIGFLLDISLTLSIELGRAELNVKDILSLQDGSVVELNKLAGDPVDIFVNDKLIARGEVVVIDDNFGVRVTDILSPAELLDNLKDSEQK